MMWCDLPQAGSQVRLMDMTYVRKVDEASLLAKGE
jgi:hypothetical protein